MKNQVLMMMFAVGTVVSFTANAADVVLNKRTETKKNNRVDHVIVDSFKATDVDGDKFIVFEEFVAFNEKKFDAVDTNKDGVITKDELAKAKEKVKAEETKNAKNGVKKNKSENCICVVEEAFDKINKKEDSKLTKKRFLKEQKKEFKITDKNKDKKISLDEYTERSLERYSEYEARKAKDRK